MGKGRAFFKRTWGTKGRGENFREVTVNLNDGGRPLKVFGIWRIEGWRKTDKRQVHSC